MQGMATEVEARDDCGPAGRPSARRAADVVNILGVPIAAINMEMAVRIVDDWIAGGGSTYITVTGVHGIIESQRDPAVREAHLLAGMCVPDGMPTVWLGRCRGHGSMTRVYGPDLMLAVLDASVRRGHTHFLYGGKEGIAESLKERLSERFPGLRIVGTYCPPFRELTEAEEREVARLVEEASPDVLWVGLSTPKQELWMARHLGRLKAKVMIGVGAAFDFHAGLVRQAPRWMQRAGLEWFFRLCMEPGRLWRRYLFNNPIFVWKAAGQLLGLRHYRMEPVANQEGSKP